MAWGSGEASSLPVVVVGCQGGSEASMAVPHAQMGAEVSGGGTGPRLRGELVLQELGDPRCT